MSRAANIIVAIVSILSVLWVVSKNPSTQEELAKHLDNVQGALQDSYVLYFEPLKESQTAQEAAEMKKHVEELTKSYLDYIEKTLGSKIKHLYDLASNAINGINVQLDLTHKALKALQKKGGRDHEIMEDKLYEFLYRVRGDDLKRWGMKLKLEKDKQKYNVQDALENSYVLYFEPLKESQTAKEAEEMKKHIEELTKSYLDYIEKTLGSKIKHLYDLMINGINVQLDLTNKALKALQKKGGRDHEIMEDKLYEFLYRVRGDDLKRWGMKLKLEKDKQKYNVQDALENSYVLYFEPLKESQTAKEAEEMKKHIEELTKSYLDYVGKTLGKVKHLYDLTINGISLQLDLTNKALKALQKKVNQQQVIMEDKLYEFLYRVKGDDLKRWGIKLKLEKDKRFGV